MHIQSLQLTHFRNLTKAFFAFSEGRNWFIGPNASGKTNLLEAIFYFIRASSFRTRHTEDLIKQGEAFAEVELSFVKWGVEQTLKFQIGPEGKQLFHNQTPYPSAIALLGILQGVLIKLDDISLINGTPPLRRAFIDLQLVQVSPLYVHHLLRFQRALKQRNFCLKTKQTKGLEAFEWEMAKSGAFLWSERLKLIEELKEPVQSFFSQLAGQELFTLQFEAAVKDAEGYFARLGQTRAQELRLGFTKEGPHRDELLFFIDNRSAKAFASEGQKRTALLALKLAEWQRLKTVIGEAPLCAIDEWQINLDQKRMANLQELLTDLGQVFMTSPHTQPGQVLMEMESGLMLVQ